MAMKREVDSSRLVVNTQHPEKLGYGMDLTLYCVSYMITSFISLLALGLDIGQEKAGLSVQVTRMHPMVLKGKMKAVHRSSKCLTSL